jgi:hypothetical protein
MRTIPILLTVLLLAPLAAVHAAEPWWHEYTPVATVGLRAESLETIQPGAAHGVGTLGWYGFWFLNAQEKADYFEAGGGKLRQAGVKRIVYYDLGEVGDYAAFFTADGKMKHNGWSLPWWDGKEPLTARWLGLDAFLRDVPWAPFPSAKSYGLPPFTTPDGQPTDDLYALLARRGLDGQWSYDYSSNPRITDDFAERSGLAKLSGKQSGPADTQGKSGWQMVRLVDVDIYVSQDKSGAGHENLHKVLAFDCLANRGLLDFGHWYLDGYSPGTPQSAGFVNRFIRAHAPRLSHRRYLADVAVVHSAWSEIASMNVFNPVMDKFVDEYCGWCDFLGDTHRQWDVVLQSELNADILARYPVVVLPSVLTLADADISELRRYVEGGGRLVATGETGTRYGPERYLAPREPGFSLPGVRIVADKPGVTYWRKDRDPVAARRMAELLDWPGWTPRLETDALATVGVNLNVGSDSSGPLLTLDLNNVDLDVATDTLRPAPAITTTIRLPDQWRGGEVPASYATPEMQAGAPPVSLAGDAAIVDHQRGTLQLRTPAFDTCLIVFLRGRTEQRGQAIR